MKFYQPTFGNGVGKVLLADVHRYSLLSLGLLWSADVKFREIFFEEAALESNFWELASGVSNKHVCVFYNGQQKWKKSSLNVTLIKV